MASPLIDSLRRLGATTSKLLLSRAEFASLELAEARVQLVRWLVLALLTTALLVLALIAASALFVVLLWPALGWVALAIVLLAYALAALVLGLRLRREIAEAPPPLSETLRQLAQDRDAFARRETPAPAESAPPREPFR
ncbi:MAG: phage holin family protein [Xanthomonadaceae bacterium]|nr:phage holin family protein [Xanthomonadaceae bacterium]